MSDGAHLGAGAEASMKAILGGDQPTELETTAEMRDRIMATTRDEGLASYDGCATYVARLILTEFLATPELTRVPTEAVVDWHDDGTWEVINVGLYEVLKTRISEDDHAVCQEMSGFQWGWAVNAARRCVELEAVPNPAILVVGIADEPSLPLEPEGGQP